jgi:hypothetical protein
MSKHDEDCLRRKGQDWRLLLLCTCGVGDEMVASVLRQMETAHDSTHEGAEPHE